MTSKTHVALGLLTALVIHKYYPHINTYDLVSGVAIGSLMPDLDTKNSDPAQIFPPIAWIVDKLTKHRGFTHTMFPLILIICYYYFDNKICLYMGIGGITHLVLDVATKLLKITCGSGGEQTLFILFWLGITLIIVDTIWTQYRLVQYVPKEAIREIEVWKNKILAWK